MGTLGSFAICLFVSFEALDMFAFDLLMTSSWCRGIYAFWLLKFRPLGGDEVIVELRVEICLLRGFLGVKLFNLGVYMSIT
jgi:hypothetical protein